MKSLPISAFLIFFVSVLLNAMQPAKADSLSTTSQRWILSALGEPDKPISSDAYLFYCTGHHGMVWSAITRDSSFIHLYNGTTRTHIEYPIYELDDTLSFIKNNIRTINWAFDSMASAARFLTPVDREVYITVYTGLYLVKEDSTEFHTNDVARFSGPDSASFNDRFKKLNYLMLWLAMPSGRQYMPIPCDSPNAEQ